MRQGEDFPMLKTLVSLGCGAAAMVALAIAPANAADELEAKLQTCNACHGQNGQPVDKSIPIIWGQTTAYLTKQLHDYRSEDRNNPVMSPLAGMIKPEEWRKVATYFTAKPWPAKQASAGPAPAAPPEQKIAVCRICHQPNFEGGLPAPRLAGQSYEYLVGAMTSFADDKRTNSQDMATLMKMLSAEERDAIAKYLAAL
jgi:cytochrome c553